jgi:hypothetical protein
MKAFYETMIFVTHSICRICRVMLGVLSTRVDVNHIIYCTSFQTIITLRSGSPSGRQIGLFHKAAPFGSLFA